MHACYGLRNGNLANQKRITKRLINNKTYKVIIFYSITLHYKNLNTLSHLKVKFRDFLTLAPHV